MSSTTAVCASSSHDVAERLHLLELDDADSPRVGQRLQDQVIRPNVDTIIEEFCGLLLKIEQFRSIVEDKSALDRLRQTLHRYLISLGVDFDTEHYFEERRRIGITHQRMGVPQSLYQCAFRQLQDLLIAHIPGRLRADQHAFDELLRFILKITALDISLAVESYCSATLSGLAESLKNERGKTARLKKLSVTDRLTDLYNHAYTKHCLHEALVDAREDGSPLAVIMADLDHFKAVNDAHGHLVGDAVLRIAAARMVSAARADDRIGRYGGEEFLFILPGTDILGARRVAERVRARIARNTFHSGDVNLAITLSLGVAAAAGNDTVDSLIRRADAALYAAKTAGRNCVRTAPADDLRSLTA